MTPQEWIEKVAEPECAAAFYATQKVHKQAFVTEGAQHLAAALEEIAQLREQVAELGRPSDLRLCGSCRQTRCMAQKERQYGKTCWMYSPNTNRDVQELRDEIARLQAQLAQAERVVVPEWDRDAFAARYPQGEWEEWEIRTAKEGYEFAASRAHSVPASRVLKDGEVAIPEKAFRDLQHFYEIRSAATSVVNLGLTNDVTPLMMKGPFLHNALISLRDALRAQGKEGAK